MGAFVGTDAAGNAVVAQKVNGVVVLLGVSGSGFDYKSSVAVAYQSTDCTGQPYLFPTNNLVTPTAVAPPGQTLSSTSMPPPPLLPSACATALGRQRLPSLAGGEALRAGGLPAGVTGRAACVGAGGGRGWGGVLLARLFRQSWKQSTV